MRRLRRTETLRRMVRETYPGRGRSDLSGLRRSRHAKGGRDPVAFRRSSAFGGPVDGRNSRGGGSRIPAVLVFGVPEAKDEEGARRTARRERCQRAVWAIKHLARDLVVITDVCLCRYTTHGHCGIYEAGSLQNDATLEVLERVAVSHAEGGRHGGALRHDGRAVARSPALDEAYSKKSALWRTRQSTRPPTTAPSGRRWIRAQERGPEGVPDGPGQQRRGPAGSGPRRRRGADIVMVKPALAYLDVARRVKEAYGVPGRRTAWAARSTP